MKKAFLSIFMTILLGCSSNVNLVNENIQKETNSLNKFSFSIKAIPLDYVKSIRARLIKVPTDPNSPSSIISSVDQDITSSTTTITFQSVRIGGPYYVAVAAYDDVVSNPLRNNITKENPNITTADKKWAISSNNVTVSASSATYSDSLTSLSVVLKIILSQASTTITITPQNGQSTTGSITVNPKI